MLPARGDGFSRYFGSSPDKLGLADVRAYQVHLVSTGVSWQALNQTVCALRFFYGVTLTAVDSRTHPLCAKAAEVAGGVGGR